MPVKKKSRSTYQHETSALRKEVRETKKQLEEANKSVDKVRLNRAKQIPLKTREILSQFFNDKIVGMMQHFDDFDEKEKWNIMKDLLPYFTPKMMSNEVSAGVHIDPLATQLGQLANGDKNTLITTGTTVETPVIENPIEIELPSTDEEPKEDFTFDDEQTPL